MKQNWFAGTLGVVALVLGTVGGPTGAANAVLFEPPSDNAAPRQSSGGASRGSFFTPPSDNAAPQQSSGGASRSGLFTPPPESVAPTSSTGGASRGAFFTPPPENAAPVESSGGASRGAFFAPPPENAAPQGGMSSGASRSGMFTATDDGATSGATSLNGVSRSNAYGATAYAPAGAAAASMLAITPDSFYGTTLEARPTILVYVPASDASEAIFSLKDEAKALVYQMSVVTPSNGGVVAIEMPADAPELAIDENYQWYVALKLDDVLSPASPFVDGWVKRIAPTSALATALAEGSGLSDIEALGANGIWYDTASQLASLQVGQADEAIAGHWFELLEAVGLADVADVPVVM
ncbi:MAG: DUF928 domain-containing protein [Cyanobacteria bacterium P01_F01_bin.53]